MHRHWLRSHAARRRRVAAAAIVVLATAAAPAAADGWELTRNALSIDRPPVADGVVTIAVGRDPNLFPRYFNELGIHTVRLTFTGPAGARRRLSVVWTGGTEGTDQFAVTCDGTPAGTSRLVESPTKPGAFYLDVFDVACGPGTAHVLELRSPAARRSAIQFSAFRLARPDAPRYQPLGYQSVGSLANFEHRLGAKGVRFDQRHLTVFAPATHARAARDLAVALEKAYGVMARIHGEDPVFRFSIENYPEGHKAGWGGISGAATIGYSTEALERFDRLRWSEARGVIGYTEEMCHGFKALFKCDGTYEALGVAVQEDVLRALLGRTKSDAYYARNHALWAQTYTDWRAAGRTNPDPHTYPWNVLFTRLLNKLFLDLRNAYGPKLWPDFFAEMRRRGYPLFRAKPPARMGIYADVFTALFKRDMRKEFTRFGIDLDVDPPWGWETYTKPKKK